LTELFLTSPAGAVGAVGVCLLQGFSCAQEFLYHAQIIAMAFPTLFA
jgi:hypothetical protein